MSQFNACKATVNIQNADSDNQFLIIIIYGCTHKLETNRSIINYWIEHMTESEVYACAQTI